MDFLNIVQIASDTFSGLGNLGLAVVGFLGLRAWRKEMEGKNRYDIARNYLRAVYKLRDVIRMVRDPWVSVNETSVALAENGISKDEMGNSKKTNEAVYSSRLSKLKEALRILDLDVLEAEVLWGKEALEVQKGLRRLADELHMNVYIFMTGGVARRVWEDVVYERDQDDEFRGKVNMSVSEIENFLKPYLGRRG